MKVKVSVGDITIILQDNKRTYVRIEKLLLLASKFNTEENINDTIK